MAHSIDRKTRVNLLLAALLALMTASSWLLIRDLRAHQQLSQDLAELRHVRYGMLNADIWVQQVSEIVERKVRELEIRGEKRESVKRALESMLDTLLTAADEYIRTQHTTGDWWDRTTGRIKESMRNTLMDIDTVKAGIPEYAEQILVELENPETREHLSAFLIGMLEDVTEETFGRVDDTLREEIRDRYACTGSVNECKATINDRRESRRDHSRYLAALVLLTAVLMLLLVRHARIRDNPGQWMMLSAGAALLLACGVLTPMIEVEAQITHLNFVLMGETVEFFNEVLYFQSKSILDVVSVLAATREPDMLVVAVLLVMFSIIFPLLKLFASAVYAYDVRGLRDQGLVVFFALKSGKWSMADVMVVAMMMAYIGFNGMISSQLDLISHGADEAGLGVVSTNGTELQMGFFLFLAFCLFSLFVSTFMQSAVEAEIPGGDNRELLRG